MDDYIDPYVELGEPDDYVASDYDRYSDDGALEENA